MKILSIIGLTISGIALLLSFNTMDLYYYDGNDDYGGYSRIGGGFILPLLFFAYFLVFSILTLRYVNKKEPLPVSSNINTITATPEIKTSQKSKPISEDTLNQLEKLGELKKKGLITDQEFDEQKKKLLL